MDPEILDKVKNCFQTTYELQKAINKKMMIGYSILLIHTNTEDGFTERDIANSRKDFTGSCQKLMRDFDRRTQKYIQDKIYEFNTCAVEVRKYSKEHKILQAYASDCYQEFSKRTESL